MLFGEVCVFFVEVMVGVLSCIVVMDDVG